MDKKTISRKTKQPQDKSRGESEVQALRAQINDCHEEIERLRHLAGTDELTELANRRSFDRELKRRIAEFNRFGTQFSLIMLDIDNFKSVNDQYGHLVGDEFLKEFAKRLRGQIRESDLLARYGGDEFVAILAGTDLQQAKYAAKRLIDNAILKTVSESNALRLSISIGIAQVQAGLSPDQLIELVDRAMYEAKNKGGDQFAVSDVS